MNTITQGLIQQKNNADLLRQRLRLPVIHGYNLPASVDLRPWMTEIEDQGEMGSCVANAIAGSLEYMYRRWTGKVLDVSRLFIDFNARISNIDWSEQRHLIINPSDPNAAFDTNRQAALRGVQQYGFCDESLWPYDESLFMVPPAKRVYREAARRSIVPLKVPINVDSVRTCLAHQIPVLVGIILSTDEADHNHGWIQVPVVPPDEGFHACLVVGYDDRTQHFIIRNSWGKDWGDKGYCYIPYRYLIDRRLVATADAFWAIAEIIPRGQMKRGYISYPNFTQHHLQYLFPLADRNYRKRRQQQRYRRHHYRHPRDFYV